MVDSKLEFPTCEPDPLKWGKWRWEVITISLATEKTIENNDHRREIVNYFIMVIVGFRWSLQHHFWQADVADLAAFTLETVQEHCPQILPEEMVLIREDLVSYHMHNRKIH